MTSDSAAAETRLPVRFAAVLDAEAAVFEELAELMPAQRKALLDADEPELHRCAACAETLAIRFRMLEHERVRLEGKAGDELLVSDEPDVVAARRRMLAALQGLMRDGAVNGTVLARLGDSVAARQAAVASMFGAAYLSDGKPAAVRAQGVSLSEEG